MFQMAMCKSFLLGMVVLGLISGCSLMPIHNPKVADVKGSWESTMYGYYSLMKIESENNGLMVVVGDEGKVDAYKMVAFQPKEKEIGKGRW